jgi:kynurenine formamidase
MCAPTVLESLHETLGRREFLRWCGLASVAAAATPVSPAGAQVPPRPGFSNVMSLTHVHTNTFPIWPGFTPIQVANLTTHEKDGFFANIWVTPEHHGTHVDAPIHFGKGAWTADAIPDAALVCPAVVIHVHDRARTNPDTQVTVDDLKAWEAKHGRIPSGAAVLMHSGWEARANDQAGYRNMDAQGAMHFPGFGKEAGEFLLKERSINGIGVDTLSLDVGASKDFAVHYSVLPANKWGIENLANLAQVPEAGATLFVGLPKIKGASGGPARILAVW